MRPLLSFAVLLLLLAVVADLSLWNRREQHREAELAARDLAHTVRIYSCGSGLEPALAGRMKTYQGVFVDDTWLYVDPFESGLRVVTLPADGGEVVIDNFDFQERAADVERFGRMLAQAPVDTVLAMGAFRHLAPEAGQEEQRRARLAALLRGIGVRSDPARLRSPSFAFLCVRRPRGFVPIAESFSTTRGLCLAFHLAADRRRYDGSHVLRVLDERRDVPLALEAAAGEGFDVEPMRVFKQIGFPALHAAVEAEQPVRMTWELAGDPALAGPLPAASFRARIALRWLWHASLDSVRFALLVDGREVGQRVVYRDGGEDSSWLDWEVLLDPLPERIESIAIEVERVGKPGPAAHVQLAEPTLQVGSIGSL